MVLWVLSLFQGNMAAESSSRASRRTAVAVEQRLEVQSWRLAGLDCIGIVVGLSYPITPYPITSYGVIGYYETTMFLPFPLL